MADLAELGAFLKQQRELKGLSREDVARTTRIAPGLIAALEEGQADRLPEQIFVQNYVRSYAKAVGLSEDEVLTRLLSVPGILPPTEQSPVLLEAARRKHAYKGLVVLLLVLTVGGLALWWWKAVG